MVRVTATAKTNPPRLNAGVCMCLCRCPVRVDACVLGHHRSASCIALGVVLCAPVAAAASGSTHTARASRAEPSAPSSSSARDVPVPALPSGSDAQDSTLPQRQQRSSAAPEHASSAELSEVSPTASDCAST